MDTAAREFADSASRFLVGQLEFLDQPFQPLGLLERIQVLTLQVLYKSDRRSLLIIDLADDDRNIRQSRQLSGTPSDAHRR